MGHCPDFSNRVTFSIVEKMENSEVTVGAPVI
jgi:hypothetical protein